MGNEQSSGANIDDLRQHNVPIKLPPAKPGKKLKFISLTQRLVASNQSPLFP